MSKKFIIGIDGTENGLNAAKFAIAMAEGTDTEIHVIHVLDWSPYSFLTMEELQNRHQRRTEELDRANTAILAPAIQELESGGTTVTGEVRYGGIPETIVEYCKEIEGDQIFVARTGESEISARVFGSVPNTLVQVTDVPVTVVP